MNGRRLSALALCVALYALLLSGCVARPGSVRFGDHVLTLRRIEDQTLYYAGGGMKAEISKTDVQNGAKPGMQTYALLVDGDHYLLEWQSGFISIQDMDGRTIHANVNTSGGISSLSAARQDSLSDRDLYLAQMAAQMAEQARHQPRPASAARRGAIGWALIALGALLLLLPVYLVRRRPELSLTGISVLRYGGVLIAVIGAVLLITSFF